MPACLGSLKTFSRLSGQIAIILILSLYWSADQFRFERLGLSLLPEQHHTKAIHVWRSMEAGVGEYLRSELIQSVLTGLLLWLGFSALGIRYPVLACPVGGNRQAYTLVWGVDCCFACLVPWYRNFLHGWNIGDFV